MTLFLPASVIFVRGDKSIHTAKTCISTMIEKKKKRILNGMLADAERKTNKNQEWAEHVVVYATGYPVFQSCN